MGKSLMIKTNMKQKNCRKGTVGGRKDNEESLKACRRKNGEKGEGSN